MGRRDKADVAQSQEPLAVTKGSQHSKTGDLQLGIDDHRVEYMM